MIDITFSTDTQPHIDIIIYINFYVKDPDMFMHWHGTVNVVVLEALNLINIQDKIKEV